MSNRVKIGIIIVIIGVVLIAIGGTAVYKIMTSPVQTVDNVEQAAIVEASVVVASRDLKLGDLLHQEDVQTINISKEFLPRDAVTDPENAIGRFIKTDIIQGEMILDHNLADPSNTNGDIAYTLADDHVLMAFPAKDLMSTLSIVERGDLVDLFVTIEQVVSVVGENVAGENPEAAPAEQSTTITFDALGRVGITALVVDIIQDQGNQQTVFTSEGQEDQPAPQATPDRSQINIRAYLLALDPQDALVLKHLIDQGAKFDIVIRTPASEIDFDLDPVTSEYIKELYGLEIIR
jgi:Flp pilus assembly protein CpaB